MRLLSASLDTDGNLEIDGHDLGPGASYASDEDEWRYTIRRRDFPQLIRLLGGVCETCAYYTTNTSFDPILEAQRDHAAQRDQHHRVDLFQMLLDRNQQTHP